MNYEERALGMLRVYHMNLNLLRQQPALDLLVGAEPLQLLAERPGTNAPPEAMAVAADGT